MLDAKEFWDKTAEGYATSPIRNEEEYKEKLEITRRYFTPESKVFEFACGTGTTAVAHAPFVESIVAIDISPKMIEICNAKALEAKVENMDFQASTIEEYSAEDESFDVAMGHSILHLVEDPEAAIAKVYKMLKPGGAFVTSTVCLGDSLNFWRLLIPVGQLFGKVPFVNSMKREELTRYFKDAGFEIGFQWDRKKNRAAFMILKKPD